MSEFDEYIVHGEPGQKEKADAWQTAIGLQDVDGLKVSNYLLDTARQHIEGDISIDEARGRIKAYYETKSGHDEVDEEGDKASANIAKKDPFIFDLDRRAILQAELDAIVAHLYGLNNDELSYILDPEDICDPGCINETFRVLKERELREYGEYCTRRLVLDAWHSFNYHILNRI